LLDFLGFGPATLRRFRKPNSPAQALGFGGGFTGQRLRGETSAVSKNAGRGPQGVGWAEEFPRRPTPTTEAESRFPPKGLATPKRTGQVLRVGNVIWVAPQPPKAGYRTPPTLGGCAVGGVSAAPGRCGPVYLFQLPDSGSGIFQPTAQGNGPFWGPLHRWCQTPGFCGVPETVPEVPGLAGTEPPPAVNFRRSEIRIIPKWGLVRW